MEPAVPPLGASMSETIDANVEPPRDAGALTMARVNECEIPAYIANDAGGPSVLEDVAYGDDKKQKYDLVLPETPPRALVVIVTSVSFRLIDKRATSNLKRYLIGPLYVERARGGAARFVSSVDASSRCTDPDQMRRETPSPSAGASS